MDEARETARRHQQRYLQSWVDEDGMVVIRGRLTPELEAVVQRALKAASDRLFRGDASDPRDDATAEVTPGQRRALRLRSGRPERAKRVERAPMHSASLLRAPWRVTWVAGPQATAMRWYTSTRTLKADAGPATEETVPPDAEHAVLEDAGGVRVSAETSRRLACNASTVMMRHAPDGTVLDVGRPRHSCA